MKVVYQPEGTGPSKAFKLQEIRKGCSDLAGTLRPLCILQLYPPFLVVGVVGLTKKRAESDDPLFRMGNNTGVAMRQLNVYA